MESFANQENRPRNVTDGVERAEVLAAYHASGLTQKAFAKRAGINYHTFISWLVQQRRAQSATRPLALPSFSSEGHSKPLEVSLPGEIVVRGHNPTDVANLVHSLRNNVRVPHSQTG